MPGEIDIKCSEQEYDLLPLFDEDMNDQSKNLIAYDLAIDSARIFSGVTAKVLKSLLEILTSAYKPISKEHKITESVFVALL